MSPLSSRFAWAALGAVLIAGVAVAVHTPRLADRDDCAHPERLHPLAFSKVANLDDPKDPPHPTVLANFRGTVTAAESVPPLRFAIIRTFAPAGISAKPGTRVGPTMDVDRKQLRWLEQGDTRVPIHWESQSQATTTRFASFVFVYDLEPTASPRNALLASALRRVLSGGRPLTLLAIGGEVSAAQVRPARAAAEAWLLSAWDHYRTTCRP